MHFRKTKILFCYSSGPGTRLKKFLVDNRIGDEYCKCKAYICVCLLFSSSVSGHSQLDRSCGEEDIIISQYFLHAADFILMKNQNFDECLICEKIFLTKKALYSYLYNLTSYLSTQLLVSN